MSIEEASNCKMFFCYFFSLENLRFFKLHYLILGMQASVVKSEHVFPWEWPGFGEVIPSSRAQLLTNNGMTPPHRNVGVCFLVVCSVIFNFFLLFITEIFKCKYRQNGITNPQCHSLSPTINNPRPIVTHPLPTMLPHYFVANAKLHVIPSVTIFMCNCKRYPF